MFNYPQYFKALALFLGIFKLLLDFVKHLYLHKLTKLHVFKIVWLSISLALPLAE